MVMCDLFHHMKSQGNDNSVEDTVVNGNFEAHDDHRSCRENYIDPTIENKSNRMKLLKKGNLFTLIEYRKFTHDYFHAGYIIISYCQNERINANYFIVCPIYRCNDYVLHFIAAPNRHCEFICFRLNPQQHCTVWFGVQCLVSFNTVFFTISKFQGNNADFDDVRQRRFKMFSLK